ncbi:MAG TPA: hypothetical protein VF796_12555 [Humisphaera sp.]
MDARKRRRIEKRNQRREASELRRRAVPTAAGTAPEAFAQPRDAGGGRGDVPAMSSPAVAPVARTSPDEPQPTERHPPLSPGWPRTLALWCGLLVPPGAWSLHLTSVYAMVPAACLSHSKLPLHLTSAFLLLVAVAGGWVACRQWRAVGRGWPSPTEPGPRGRARSLAVMGMMASALFTLVICGQWVYVFAINPCVE